MTMNYAFEQIGTVTDFLEFNCECSFDDSKADAIDGALQAASDVLVKITGGRVRGRRTTTVWPYRTGGCVSGNARDVFQLLDLDAIPIPGILPVITRVKIDGEELDGATYKMFNGPNLVRLGGDWPSSNDLTALDDDQPGTFTIAYTHGDNGGILGVQASCEIACSLLRAHPAGFGPGVTSASVQGVSISIDDAADEIRQGGDDYPHVQRLLASFAPSGAGRSTVWSPELELGWELVTRT